MIQCENGDWICSAGTIIYNGRLGEQALRDCYADFVAGGIQTLRSTAIGHYAVAIKLKDKVSIFTDQQGALNLYYISEGSFWFVSNSLQVCASALPNLKIDATKLLVIALQTQLPGEDTFYAGIKRLFGTQVIQIDLGLGTFCVERIPKRSPVRSHGLSTILDFIDQYKQEVRTVFQELAAVGQIGLFATGGMDSRTILAALLDQKAPLMLMYGVGNSRLTDYHARDLDIARTVAELYNLSFKQLDWSGNQPHDEESLQEIFQTYGFQAEIYGAPESFLRAFNGGITPYPTLLLGGYSPAFTSARPWELPQQDFTFGDLVSDAMRFQGSTVEESRCLVDKDAYRSAFAAEVRTGLNCAEIHYPDTGASLDTFVEAKLFLYIRAESRFLNLANEFGHYVAPFLMTRLYDPLLSVPLRYRAKDEFQLRLIHALEPELVRVPFFSSLGQTKVNPATFHSVPDCFNQRGLRARRIANFVLSSALRVQARNIFSHLKRPVKTSKGRDSAIITTYGRQIMNDPLGSRWFNSTAEFTPKDLARIRHYLVAVNTLGYSE
jgi:hypothetical protein